MIPDTVAGVLRLIDRGRWRRGVIEDELARRGWPWRASWSLWLDELIALEEAGRQWSS